MERQFFEEENLAPFEQVAIGAGARLALLRALPAGALFVVFHKNPRQIRHRSRFFPAAPRGVILSPPPRTKDLSCPCEPRATATNSFPRSLVCIPSASAPSTNPGRRGPLRRDSFPA